MNLNFRLAYAICLGFIAEALNHRHPLISRYRVWPHDLVAFGHMNNGRHLQIMDVARAEWMTRVGVVSCMWRQRWTAVLGDSVIRFRRSLKPFQRYQVRTRLLSWDRRWWYLNHTFLDTQGRRVATGISRAALRSGNAWVETESVVDLLQPGATAPPMSGYVRDWLRLEQEMWSQGRAKPATNPRPAEEPRRMEMRS